ncbi:MAG: type II toxin-antitoxin system HicB family antitoxin [Phycisphaerae bacterium]|nr:type II toxin-antitoxin system HicB family antitoxin [Phycisphaerae bacterium]
MKFVISMVQESPDKWRAWVPELPGCAVRGRSRLEISQRIDQAIRGYLSSWDVSVPPELEEELVQLETVGSGRVALAD